MRTDTWEFQAVWGRKPRGVGLWCLIVNGQDEKGQHHTERYFESGTLMQAKKKACHQFREAFGVRRIGTVKVMP